MFSDLEKKLKSFSRIPEPVGYPATNVHVNNKIIRHKYNF